MTLVIKATSPAAVGSLLWMAVAAAAQPGPVPPGGPATAPDPRADAAYVQMMLWHGQRALELTGIGLDRAGPQELHYFVGRLAEDQRRDLEELQRWRQPAGRGADASQVPVLEAAEDDPDTAGMMERLRALPPGEFDARFLSTLIAHQEMGVQLSRNPARFASAEVRAFAKRYVQRYGAVLTQLRLMQRGS
jgi:uncharacterized protein (DUF305 family)